MSAPLYPNPRIPADISTITEYFADPNRIKRDKFALQLKRATELNQKTNDNKYDILRLDVERAW